MPLELRRLQLPRRVDLTPSVTPVLAAPQGEVLQHLALLRQRLRLIIPLMHSALPRLSRMPQIQFKLLTHLAAPRSSPRLAANLHLADSVLLPRNIKLLTMDFTVVRQCSQCLSSN